MNEQNQEDFPIYRIMSIYEFYELYNRKKLKLTSYSKQSDKDDGLEKSILFILMKDFFDDLHKNIRKTQYMTCWTKTRESVAMWSLYSPCKESILVKTTRNKLRDVLQKLKYPYSVNLKDEFVVENYSIQNADYKNLMELLNDIDRGRKENLLSIGMNIETKFLKDVSYQHENEVRGSVVIEYPVDLASIHLLAEYVDDIYQGRDIPADVQMELTYNTKYDLPPVIYAITDSNFIEEISFDPRMAPYKRDVLIEMLKIRDKSIITEANTFKSIKDS
ncbi:DUF2971 domain-containing protein [Rodentibacter ratti]|uniref:DUF2971 domain-containing protein n=1 Tax=Rodentibacter ratti TaxID=1906745 RepID=UPI001300DBDE|nr:hypothetical protein [Rodentibacter ratti]